MNDGAKKFDCCVQCHEFWTCKKRAEDIKKGIPTACCNSCANLELCKIVIDKIKDNPGTSPH